MLKLDVSIYIHRRGFTSTTTTIIINHQSSSNHQSSISATCLPRRVARRDGLAYAPYAHAPWVRTNTLGNPTIPGS